jgi:arsenate reductase (glutaredoxin)
LRQRFYGFWRRVLAITVYGIKSCNTMKKARTWLDSHGVQYEFHDYKAVGIDADVLKRWAGEVGWEVLLNRAGTTFRKLPDEQKTGLNERKAISLMVAQPSMIKRPVLEKGGKVLVGFDPAVYKKELTPG